MSSIINDIINFLSGDKVFPALISALTTVVVFFLTILTKNFIETKVLSSKLDTEHKFDQRKKIKEVLAKHKVHLLTACEDLNHRMWNFASNYKEGWLNIQGNYSEENYYFHSFVYRILSMYAWIKKIQKEMIFLDTTIAIKEDLDFIKFLKVFSQIFCDLTFIQGRNVSANYAKDHFFRNNFELLPDCIVIDVGVKSYSAFIKELPELQSDLIQFFLYLDNVSPTENRTRWDRLHLLNLTLIIFLNKYGYDFQRTIKAKMQQAITIPKVSNYLENYFTFLKEYKLENNDQVRQLKRLAKSHFNSKDRV